MNDQAATTRTPPKDFTEMIGQILSDIGLTDEDVSRLPRQEGVQDIKNRLWSAGQKTPVDHPKGEQTVAFIAEEGAEIRVYSVPAAGNKASGFALWKFRTDVPGFRFSFLPLSTFMLYLGREFERQVEEVEGENVDEYDAAVAYAKTLPADTLISKLLADLEAGAHLEDDGEEPDEPEVEQSATNGAPAAAPPAS